MRTTRVKVRHAQAMTHMLPRQLPFFSASAGTSSSRSAGRAATTHMLPRQLPLLSNSAGTPVSGLEMGAVAERMLRVEYMAGMWDEGVDSGENGRSRAGSYTWRRDAGLPLRQERDLRVRPASFKGSGRGRISRTRTDQP
jgi:hypothetical protein